MRQTSATWAAFRRALWASVALHAIAAGVLLLLVCTTEDRKPLQPKIDTHVADEPQVRMYLVEDAVVTIEPQPAQVAPQPSEAPHTAPVPNPAPPQVAQPVLPDKPFAPTTPQTLSPEILAIIRKPTPQPAHVETHYTPNTNNTPTPNTNNAAVIDPNVKPVVATNTNSANANTSSTGTSPHAAIHGPLKPEQTVVYVLDCSGSMGAAGKLDAARTALISTLKQQPATVRFQVIVYRGRAGPLLASDGKGLPATDANIRAAVKELAAIEARGKSNHLEAVGVALAFRPDVILILTDADDLNPALLKRILARAPKPVLVCVGQVTPEGVQISRELK
jgi:hypothetical protein